ncbi:MAG: hypothetical protein RI900_2099, partial [Actinomycetota bacterium]
LTAVDLDRAVGALLGSAVGDALGAPFEFGPAGEYSARFPQPVIGGSGEMTGGGGFGWAAGEFTDDTQMAIALAESLIAHGGIDPADLWQRWRAWADTASDVGIITRAALGHPENHGAAASAHRDLGRSAGNGALMRTVAVGLWFADPSRSTQHTGTQATGAQHTGTQATITQATITQATMQAALEQAALTHHDPAAGWGAAIAAELVRRTIIGADPLAELPDVLGQVPAGVAERFATMLHPEWQPGDPSEPGNGSVWGCLAQAVWALRHHHTFHDVVTAAIDLGGDTDTVACVAGALAGARHGMQAIPSRWTTYVHGRVDTPEGVVRYDNASLQGLAIRLLGRMPGPLSAFDRSAGPQQVLPGVWAADLSAAGAATDREFAVLSLCRTGGAFTGRPVRREVYLFDQEHVDANPSLHTAVLDAVDTIQAWRAEGREVLVHCHGGRSRTALVLKAYAMRTNGWSADDAHEWLLDTWHAYDPWNLTFGHFLRTEWAK